MKISSRKQLCFRKCPQNRFLFSPFPLTLSILLLFLILFFPFPVCSLCLLQQQPWGSWAELSSSPCSGVAQQERHGGNSPPETHVSQCRQCPLLAAILWYISSPCALKNVPFNNYCIKLAHCLTAQKGSSHGSLSAETKVTKFCCTFCLLYWLEENMLKYSDIPYNIYHRVNYDKTNIFWPQRESSHSRNV